MDRSITDYCQDIDAFGYTHIKNIYQAEEITRIEKTFDADFIQRLQAGQVQSRDFRRYTCKLPISEDYLPILHNPAIHEILTQLLGEGYVLFNFNSHSSLPGSSQQIMHVDSVDPLNSSSYASKETNVVFLHIPLIDTQSEHGATGVWPATFFEQEKGIGDAARHKWIKEKLPQSSAKLQRGDVIIKRDNCVHAGGANRSDIRRHLITLIFVRKHTYLQHNTGMIPCANYSKVLSTQLPYRIAAQCDAKQVPSLQTYQAQKNEPVVFEANDVKQSLAFLQYFQLPQALSSATINTLAQQATKLEEHPNTLFNLIESNLPLLRTIFGKDPFYFHSASLNQQTHALNVDDPTFKQSLGQSVFNNLDNSIKLHIALEDTENCFSVWAGNKVLSQSMLQDNNSHAAQKKIVSLKAGDMLITTGTLVHAKHQPAKILELTFTRTHHLPSYTDRYYVSDAFFLSLPNALSRLIRYETVFINDEKYRHFQYKRLTHLAYILINQVGNLRVKNKPLGTALGVLTLPFFIPVGLYLSLVRSKHHAKHALGTN